MVIFEAKKGNEDLDTLKANRLADSAYELTGRIAGETGERKAGSEATRKCARLLLEELRKYCDDSLITSFRSSEASYGGVLKLIAVCTPLILFLDFLGCNILSLLLFVFTVFLFVKEYLLCDGPERQIFRASDMTNVHGSIEPDGTCTDTIVFTSHHDAAPLYGIRKNDRMKLFLSLHLPLIHYGITGLVTVSGLIADIFTGELFSVNLPPVSIIVLLVLLAGTAFIYLWLWRLISDKYSPGIGDNLVSACALTQLARYFSWKKVIGEGFAGTRLVFASFDGEECGLKGSRWWFSHHKEQLVNPVVINLDSLCSSSDLTFLTKDVNGFTDLSATLAAELSRIADRMGYPSKVGAMPLFSGATDAASAARAGIESVTVTAVPMDGSTSVIHTEDDTLEHVERKALEEVISVCIRFAEERSSVRVKVSEPVPALENPEKRLQITRN
ncbi:MAG: M28 family peptidase [Bullifex sp.]